MMIKRDGAYVLEEFEDLLYELGCILSEGVDGVDKDNNRLFIRQNNKYYAISIEVAEDD